ncbi:hypothetical protein MYSTI_01521 [Myxococcus stipitatus DSM 14675]|uniref:Lipoprotein n=1 Tax=Myxococcus stipitatus (strain DSM 14675 / JCM 12634 / Mx s8) TaxID=1278073 RepID=L7U246_MYXSD|nr:hypothetical protein MYSTI_01521 [Myxococcus stipitatus DSM 14675]
MRRNNHGLSLTLFIVGLLSASASHADTWRGTAPFCDGGCLPGETEITQSKVGDGGYCWSGHKTLCRNDMPTCPALQTKTMCLGVVLICDNGSYQANGQWRSCSKYACGGCLFGAF